MKEEVIVGETELYSEEEITCPNCGYLRHGGDSFEAGDGGTQKCEECGKDYVWARDVSVTYSSKIV